MKQLMLKFGALLCTLVMLLGTASCNKDKVEEEVNNIVGREESTVKVTLT